MEKTKRMFNFCGLAAYWGQPLPVGPWVAHVWGFSVWKIGVVFYSKLESRSTDRARLRKAAQQVFYMVSGDCCYENDETLAELGEALQLFQIDQELEQL